MIQPRHLLLPMVLFAVGCSGQGVSTAEAERAAEARIREAYKLDPGVELRTRVFVGRPREGDVVLCGITSDPTGQLAPQRFIAATDPARWLQLAPYHASSIHAQPDKFVEWDQHCAGAAGDTPEDPLAPTVAGKDS